MFLSKLTAATAILSILSATSAVPLTPPTTGINITTTTYTGHPNINTTAPNAPSAFPHGNHPSANIHVTNNNNLQTRDSGSFTWYNTGLGACGQWNNDGDLIVAMNAAQFDANTPNGNPNNNWWCNRQIRISYQGRTVDARIVDRCPGCAWGGLDLSPAAFQRLADLGAGRVSGDWWFI